MTISHAGEEFSVENLVSGTSNDIKKEVEYTMEHYKPGGRYIFGSTHSIAVGTKYENFMTMAEEFKKRGENKRVLLKGLK